MKPVNRPRVRVALSVGLVAGMTWVLSACGGGGGGGGGGGEEPPPLEMVVSVNGVSDASNPLTIGESTTINVASGSTLVFTSEEDSRWAPVATNSSFSVDSFSLTEKAMTVSSNTGGTVLVVFSDARDVAKTATLTVVVAPREFARVSPKEGQFFDWEVHGTRVNGEPWRDAHRRVTHLEGSDGGYSLNYFAGPDLDQASSRFLYDTQDRYLGWDHPLAPVSCSYDNPLVYQSYPLHVGKAWVGTARRDCEGGPAEFDMAYERSVDAFERLTVPAGTFDTLRIKSEIHYSNVSGDSGPSSYDVTRTCWWAVDLGRDVKCEYAFHYPDGDWATSTATSVETLTAYSP